MQIVVNELLTTYETQGKGKLVLLLHGWGDSSKGLRGLIQELSVSHQVLALDLPGFGGTQAPRAVWGLDDYAEFVQAALDKLELKQPYALVGHSNGGALAIRAISLGNLQPQKLVLLAASGIRNKKYLKRALLAIVAKTGNLATLWMPNRYRQALRTSLYGAAKSDMLVMPELQETFKKTVRQDVQTDAANLKLPTLLIYGARDEDVPVAYGETYHRLIKDSRLEVLIETGHFVHLDQPEKVSQLIKEFLV
jgi:pimeloyl-ACP methyl ester carboxylesterase